jgi:Fe-S cluster biosynthesis and repair protein YggX
VEVFTKGWAVADERGDRVPRDAMAKHLEQLGAPIPKKQAAAPTDDGDDGPGTGFRCQRPGCMEGKRARQLDKPPVPDAIGLRIQQDVCSACWTLWLKDYSIKVVNELRLDLSSEGGQGEYDKHMRDFFGFEGTPPSDLHLVQFGKSGFVGRFASPHAVGRGARVVVRSPRGEECGVVLCEPGEPFSAALPPRANCSAPRPRTTTPARACPARARANSSPTRTRPPRRAVCRSRSWTRS